MNGMSSGRLSFRITRPTVVSMYCLMNSMGSVWMMFWVSKACTRAIKPRYTGRGIHLVHPFHTPKNIHTEPIEFIKQYMDTTVGRVILNDNLPEDMPFINGLLKKKGLAQLVQYGYLKFG